MAMDAYPYKGFRFKIEIGGTVVAGFNEVSSFDATIDVVEYREGDASDITPRKQPGLIKYNNVSFKRGIIDAIEFYEWLDNVHQAKIERKDISIHLLKDDGEAVATTWNLLKAWPCKYQGPDLKGNASEVAIETIEFAHEGLVRAKS